MKMSNFEPQKTAEIQEEALSKKRQENLGNLVESYTFCNDVLEIAQNRPQPEVDPKILFSVPANTIITSKIQTCSKSAPSDIISREYVK